MNLRAQHLYESIAQSWAHRPEVRDVCSSILAFLARPPKKHYLTLGIIRDGIGLREMEKQEELATAIQYLLGDVAPVLTLGFEIIDERGNPIRITGDEALAAREQGINPLTGEFEQGIERQVAVFLMPAEGLCSE